MSVWGKIVGGATGFAIGGPIGALVGAVAGHVYDTSRADAVSRPVRQPERQVAFTIAVIALSAKLAKADGVVTRDEVAAFKRIFRIPPGEEKNVARVFDLARKHTHGYEPYARQVAGLFTGNPAVLEELLDCLFHIARADGRVTEDELAYLRNVADLFGLSATEFNRIQAENIGPDKADPYQILGVAHDASEDDLRATYRRLVRENHPDKLIAEGMPEEFISVANDKLAAINAAYDRIEKERKGAD